MQFESLTIFFATSIYQCCWRSEVTYLGLQVGQVGDDDDDKEVDDGDRAQDDHHQQQEHGKASADPIPAKGLLEVNITVMMIPCQMLDRGLQS